MDDGRNIGSDGSERAQILLGKIAELLRVDRAFFLAPRRTAPAPEANPAELLRLFRSIDDPELRRSVIAMLEELEAKDGPRGDS